MGNFLTTSNPKEPKEARALSPAVGRADRDKDKGEDKEDRYPSGTPDGPDQPLVMPKLSTMITDYGIEPEVWGSRGSGMGPFTAWLSRSGGHNCSRVLDVGLPEGSNGGPKQPQIASSGAEFPCENGAGVGSHPWVPTPLGTYPPRYPASWVPRGVGTHPRRGGTLPRGVGYLGS